MTSEASLGLLGDAELTDVTIRNGSTGILISSGTHVTLTRLYIGNSGNDSLQIATAAQVDIVDSTLEASLKSGISSSGNVTIHGSTINNALDRAIDNRGVMSITNSTISGNQATHSLQNRGVVSNAGTLDLMNVTVANNTSGPLHLGPNIYP
jgi:hypothetical protein